jgi:hypothetical protein
MLSRPGNILGDDRRRLAQRRLVRLGQVLDFLSFSALRVSRQELQNVVHVDVEGANE